MNERNNKIGVLMLFAFLLLVISIASTYFTGNHAGLVFRLEQVVITVSILLFWPMLYHVVRVFGFNRYKQLYQKDVPYLFVTIIRFLFGLFALMSFVVFVLEKSIFSFVAIGGLVSAGLTFALGGLILDAFAGLVHEVEGPFDVDDWIKFADGIEGKVIRVNLRTVILQTRDNYMIVLPHGKLSQGFTNYSRPDKPIWDSIEITLDHSVPVDRAERILHAAVLGVSGLHQNMCKVIATKLTEGGIIYTIRYMIPEILVKLIMKHTVIESVTRHLHDHGLKVSQALGDYGIALGDRPYEEDSPLSISNVLDKVPLFNDLSKSDKGALSSKAVQHTYKMGETIFTQGDKGDSLFIIAEGAVDVYLENKKQSEPRVKISTLCDPHYFGEMSLLLNEPRAATVLAACNSIIYEITQADLMTILKKHPDTLAKMQKEAKDRRSSNAGTVKEMKKKDSKADKEKTSLLKEIEEIL
jgi:small-conductance mechanosensitive channel